MINRDKHSTYLLLVSVCLPQIVHIAVYIIYVFASSYPMANHAFDGSLNQAENPRKGFNDGPEEAGAKLVLFSDEIWRFRMNMCVKNYKTE